MNEQGQHFLWKIDGPFIRNFYGGLVLNIENWDYSEGARVSLQVGIGNQDG
jgi:hypothetical protein